MIKGLSENGWNVMCNISQIVIDVDSRMGHLYLPELNVPDMTSVINCFTNVDPECNIINTYVNGVPDVMYVKDDDGWHVEYPDEASDYPEIHEYQIVVENIQEKHPRLTQFGFGGQGDIRPEAVQKCVEWLLRHDATERRKTVNTKVSSYTWKHIVERHFDSYIANGEFICAALYLGYKMKTSDGPNAWFNIRDRTKQ
jgi:hypothetical protein